MKVTRKQLLKWLILQQVYLGQRDSSSLAESIPAHVPFFDQSISLKTQVHNLVISLETQELLLINSALKTPSYKLSATGKEVLFSTTYKWRDIFTKQLHCLEHLLHVCQDMQPSKKPVHLSTDESNFLNQLCRSKHAMMLLMLLELTKWQEVENEDEYVSIAKLLKNIQLYYGLSCSYTTFTKGVSTLIEEGLIDLEWRTQANNQEVRFIRINDKGLEAVPSYSTLVRSEIETTLEKCKVTCAFLKRMPNEEIDHECANG
ncbi:hypothetical protein [Halalkalibacter krulwichiae]|uniref:Uncharacterized protein n=1 Tax=Halalkalibacter krulwichiae TaxID=199441 RepID=A0A1X9MJ33_9BACI|nr:hypothetical protein [Halalkalibacter krulwichiae]ARK32700.1 hypothetical protein BkAM31D_24160 [Halalkalibacter krulwichiae]